MRRTMRWLSRALVVAIAGALLLAVVPTASAQRRRVVIVQPAPIFWGGPWWWGPYDPYYPYPADYISANYGFVKIDTHHRDKNDSVYVDNGFAAKVKDGKKFALRPGNHNIELRDPNGHRVFQERVAVIVGKTTKVDLPG